MQFSLELKSTKVPLSLKSKPGELIVFSGVVTAAIKLFKKGVLKEDTMNTNEEFRDDKNIRLKTLNISMSRLTSIKIP